MLAIKGIIQGNTVILENDNLEEYDGKDAIVTILDFPYKDKSIGNVDLKKYVMPSERGKNADEYVRGLRENDRL